MGFLGAAGGIIGSVGGAILGKVAGKSLGAENEFQANQAYTPGADYLNMMQQAGGSAQQWANRNNEGRESQLGLLDQLNQQSMGNGPSLAREQMYQGLGTANRQMAGSLAGGRGLNPALQARMAMQGGAANQQSLLGQSAMLRAQEQLSAQQQRAGLLNQMRGSDIASMQNQTGLQTAFGQLNNTQNAVAVQNAMGSQGINAQGAQQNAAFGQALTGGMVSGLAGALGGSAAGGGTKMLWHGGEVRGYADGGDVLGSVMGSNDSLKSQFLNALQSNNSAYEAAALSKFQAPKKEEKKDSGGLPELPGEGGEEGAGGLSEQIAGTQGPSMPAFGSLIGGGSAAGGAGAAGAGGAAAGGASLMELAPLALMASDENVKTDVKDGSRDIQGFLDALGEHKYKYKSGKGLDNKEHVSPMAQELEQSDTGKQMVSKQGDTRMIDYSKSGPTILASLAHLNHRMNEMSKGAAAGGKVPGKSTVSGDSPENDNVLAKLSPGEIVIPRSIAMSEDAPQKAMEFVAAIQKKNKSTKSYGEVAAAKKKAMAYGGMC